MARRGRPPLGKTAMSNAERQRRQRIKTAARLADLEMKLARAERALKKATNVRNDNDQTTMNSATRGGPARKER